MNFSTLGGKGYRSGVEILRLSATGLAVRHPNSTALGTPVDDAFAALGQLARALAVLNMDQWCGAGCTRRTWSDFKAGAYELISQLTEISSKSVLSNSCILLLRSLSKIGRASCRERK